MSKIIPIAEARRINRVASARRRDEMFEAINKDLGEFGLSVIASNDSALDAVMLDDYEQAGYTVSETACDECEEREDCPCGSLVYIGFPEMFNDNEDEK